MSCARTSSPAVIRIRFVPRMLLAADARAPHSTRCSVPVGDDAIERMRSKASARWPILRSHSGGTKAARYPRPAKSARLPRQRLDRRVGGRARPAARRRREARDEDREAEQHRRRPGDREPDPRESLARRPSRMRTIAAAISVSAKYPTRNRIPGDAPVREVVGRHREDEARAAAGPAQRGSRTMRPTSPTIRAGWATSSVTAIGPNTERGTAEALIMLTANSAAVLVKTRTTASSRARDAAGSAGSTPRTARRTQRR